MVGGTEEKESEVRRRRGKYVRQIEYVRQIDKKLYAGKVREEFDTEKKMKIEEEEDENGWW